MDQGWVGPWGVLAGAFGAVVPLSCGPVLPLVLMRPSNVIPKPWSLRLLPFEDFSNPTAPPLKRSLPRPVAQR